MSSFNIYQSQESKESNLFFFNSRDGFLTKKQKRFKMVSNQYINCSVCHSKKCHSHLVFSKSWGRYIKKKKKLIDN